MTLPNKLYTYRKSVLRLIRAIADECYFSASALSAATFFSDICSNWA
jgi:hypothetical protein